MYSLWGENSSTGFTGSESDILNIVDKEGKTIYAIL